MQYKKLRKIIKEILKEQIEEDPGLNKEASYRFYFKELKAGKAPEEAYEEANRKFKIFQSKNPELFSKYSAPSSLSISRDIMNPEFKNLKDFKAALKAKKNQPPNPNLAKIPISKRTRRAFNRTVLIPEPEAFLKKIEEIAFIQQKIDTYINKNQEGKDYWTEEGLGWWEEEGYEMIGLFSKDDLVPEERFHLDKDDYFRLPYDVKNK